MANTKRRPGDLILDRYLSDADEETRKEWLRNNVVPLDYPEPVAADYPDLLEIVERKVKPDRQNQGSIVNPARWWMFARPATNLKDTLSGRRRAIALARVSEYGGFTYLPAEMVFAETVVVTALESYAAFTIVQSRVHDVWARFFSSSLEDRLRYSPSDCFETFPFPEGFEHDPALQEVGTAYYEFRADIMQRRNEGLTTIYSWFHDPETECTEIPRLRELHDAMDRAVLDAYGWPDIRPRCEFVSQFEDEGDEDENGRPSRKRYRLRWPEEVRDDVLARLLILNEQRAAAEALEPKMKKKKSKHIAAPLFDSGDQE